MDAVLNLAAFGIDVAIAIVSAVLILKTDGKGCYEGGPDCRYCPSPCKYKR